MSEPTFFKIGNRIVNFKEILVVDLNLSDEDGHECIRVNFGGEDEEFFHFDEAEILMRFLLAGNRTYDLNNLYESLPADTDDDN